MKPQQRGLSKTAAEVAKRVSGKSGRRVHKTGFKRDARA